MSWQCNPFNKTSTPSFSKYIYLFFKMFFISKIEQFFSILFFKKIKKTHFNIFKIVPKKNRLLSSLCSITTRRSTQTAPVLPRCIRIIPWWLLRVILNFLNFQIFEYFLTLVKVGKNVFFFCFKLKILHQPKHIFFKKKGDQFMGPQNIINKLVGLGFKTVQHQVLLQTFVYNWNTKQNQKIKNHIVIFQKLKKRSSSWIANRTRQTAASWPSWLALSSSTAKRTSRWNSPRPSTSALLLQGASTAKTICFVWTLVKFWLDYFIIHYYQPF